KRIHDRRVGTVRQVKLSPQCRREYRDHLPVDEVDRCLPEEKHNQHDETRAREFHGSMRFYNTQVHGTRTPHSPYSQKVPPTIPNQSEAPWFPGRWVSGVSMVLAPLLLLTGIVLRLQFHFFFPQQLTAFNEHPALITASYNLFLAGN